MAGKFTWTCFEDVNLNDSFFSSLKNDYVEFSDWFRRKARAGEKALVYFENNSVGAFIYLKDEKEEIQLADRILPAKSRMKIGTLKLSETIRNIRLGEGALGVALWKWKESRAEEIYVTTFEKQKNLIALFERFGFKLVGKNERGECVYIKNRREIDTSNPLKSFPFINNNFTYAGLLPIEDRFHDKLFPYSELQANQDIIEESVAGNGISKVYIATPYKRVAYYKGEPLCVYRKFNGEHPGFKSVVTSYVTIVDVKYIKRDGNANYTFEQFKEMCGNKTIFTERELSVAYQSDNVVCLQMVYNGYFGKGNNVNYNKLKSMGCFETYPYQITYSHEQFEAILREGHVDIGNIYA